MFPLNLMTFAYGTLNVEGCVQRVETRCYKTRRAHGPILASYT